MSQARDQIFAWSDAGRIPGNRLQEALLASGAWPAVEDWHRFASRLLWILGAVWVAAGIVFFFAFNWQALPRWGKFALAQGVLIAVAAAAWRAGPQRQAGKAALLGAVIILGANLALFGQIYQTGADTYQLFAVWAVLALPWTIAARWSVAWLFWLLLLNLAVGLYYAVFSGIWGWLSGPEALLWAHLVLNALALAAWEAGRTAGWSWMQSRWPGRLLAWVVGGLATVMGGWAVLDTTGQWAMLTAYLGWTACIWLAYRHWRMDLPILAGWVLSLIVVTACLLVRILGFDATASFWLVSAAVIGMAVLGANWLRGLAAERGPA